VRGRALPIAKAPAAPAALAFYPDRVSERSERGECTVDLSWVAPHLAIGASFLAVQVRELEDCGFRRVVDLRAEAVQDPALFERHGIRLLHLPTPDLQPLPDDLIARGVA
jgi:hypothetical protein